jgi:hypothetical protein
MKGKEGGKEGKTVLRKGEKGVIFVWRRAVGKRIGHGGDGSKGRTDGRQV